MVGIDRNKAEQPVPTVAPRGLRISDAARYMGVSPWYVELKIRSGELPAYRLCRHYTLFLEDLDNFLNDQKERMP